MAKNKNLNLLNIEDMKNEISYNDFQYKKHFNRLCDLIPNNDKEKLDIKIIDKDNYFKKGLIYVFIIENRIFKIGQTINSIENRISSYNCGRIKNRIAGTCSTTNYFILQSILKMKKKVKVYVFFPKKPTINVFGEKLRTSRPITKVIENKIITDFIKKHKRKPIGLTQK